ncbi:CLIP4 protein, partial [Atractosteus spatula]|nr:CLIP4 protein [Atractosteus spatula]
SSPEFSFFDPNEPKCRAILLDPRTSVPELFAVLRQWVPQVQQNISLIGNEILKRGCGVNDRDGLTDMTLLHYTCKAGAPGIGDGYRSCVSVWDSGYRSCVCQCVCVRQWVQELCLSVCLCGTVVGTGAVSVSVSVWDSGYRSCVCQCVCVGQWVQELCLSVCLCGTVGTGADHVMGRDACTEVDATCSDFDFGTPLHIAASNLCVSAVRCLLELGANPAFRWVIRNYCFKFESLCLRQMLDTDACGSLDQNSALFKFPTHLLWGLKIINQVLLSFDGIGEIICCGGLDYRPHSALLRQRDTVTPKEQYLIPAVSLCSVSGGNERGQCPVDVVPEPLDMPLEMADAAALAKELRQLLQEALPQEASLASPQPDRTRSLLSALGLRLGDRVVIAGQKVGTLRFCGGTEFASGQWAGVELDDPEGKNDGSVGGVQYFSCQPKHGIFAPLSKIGKASERRRATPRSSTPLRSGRLDLSHVTAKINTVVSVRGDWGVSHCGAELCVGEGATGVSRTAARSRVSVRGDWGVPHCGAELCVGVTGVSRTAARSCVSVRGDWGVPHCGAELCVVIVRVRSSSLPAVLCVCMRSRYRVPAPLTALPASVFWGHTTARGPPVKHQRAPPIDSPAPPLGADQPCEAHPGSSSLHASSRSSSSSSLDSKTPPHGRPPHTPLGHCRPALCPTHHWVTVALHCVPHTTGSLSPCTVSHTPLGHCRPALCPTHHWVTVALHCPGPRTPSVSSVVSEEPEVQLGERVLVVGQRTGVVRFCGKTSFAPGLWLGIELDKPSGKNDGSVGGVQYFSCPPKHGVFAPPSRVQRIHGSLDSLSELSAARLNHTFPGMRRSLSTSSALTAQREASRRSPVSRTRPPGLRRSWSTASTGKAAGGSGVGTPGSDGAVKLHLGMTVLLTSANEMGTVRYLGPADFAPGLWLGLELRAPKGKNDGSVGDRRYFSCRPGHGVLVRPSRVTYRGINGAKLVDEGS